MRVLVADDQSWLRSALRLLLEQEAGVEIVGEAPDVKTLLSMTGKLHPDLILLDWELPGLKPSGRGHAFLATLRSRTVQLHVIVLSGRPESGRLALAAGANAFVSKADPPEKLLAALRQAKHSISAPKGVVDGQQSQ